VLEIIKDAVFNRQDPIIIGVKVKAGFLKIGTPLCIPEKDVSFSFFYNKFFRI
jgi:translation initiation factor 5B